MNAGEYKRKPGALRRVDGFGHHGTCFGGRECPKGNRDFGIEHHPLESLAWRRDGRDVDPAQAGGGGSGISLRQQLTGTFDADTGNVLPGWDFADGWLVRLRFAL